MDDDTLTGGCLCGAVRVEVRGDPTRVPICHCRTCQKNTGAAFLSGLVYPDDRVTITGKLKGFQAPEVDRRFCPECGSLVCLVRPGQDEYILMSGCFDVVPDLAPDYELFVGHRHPWLPEIPGTVRYAGYRDGEPLPEGGAKAAKGRRKAK